jgi:glycosyltransferase involved in cell wall biosynthesis
MIVAVSADAAEIARVLERVPASKLMVIHNGIDLSFYRPSGDERRPGTRAICVARLDTIKDHETLLKAARKVADLRPDFRLDLFGDGPQRASLEELRGRLGLEQIVTLNGQASEVRHHLANSDLFVLSSRSEGISIAILEAMAVGLPVVATDVGGNREVVVHGQTGLLVPAGSPDALAEAMRALVDDPGRSSAMGRAGRDRVEREFDVRCTAARYEHLYQELLARPRAPGGL